MKRKRLMKLLMSRGMQRNEAVKSITFCQKNGISYQMYWYEFVMGKCREVLMGLGDAVRKCAEAVSELVISMQSEHNETDTLAIKGDD